MNEMSINRNNDQGDISGLNFIKTQSFMVFDKFYGILLFFKNEDLKILSCYF